MFQWTVNGELRVGFFSRRLIRKGEEITFDYKYERYGQHAQKCFCGAKICRGWLGGEPDKENQRPGQILFNIQLDLGRDSYLYLKKEE